MRVAFGTVVVEHVLLEVPHVLETRVRHSTSCKNRPVWLSSQAATRSGGPAQTRRPRADELAAATALGAEVEDPVGALEHFEVVLDDDDGVAVVRATRRLHELPKG